MSLITLLGVYALAFGHVTLTQSMKFKGNEARLFGAVLIVVAAYGMPHLHTLIDVHTAKLVGNNEAFKSAYGMLVGAFAAYATAWIMTRRAVRVSIKRLRLA